MYSTLSGIKVCLSLLLFAWILPAQAHDPGMSRIEAKVLDSGIQAQLTFAHRDIEILIPLDLNQDNKVSMAEWRRAKPHIYRFAAEILQIKHNGGSYLASVEQVELYQSDAVRFHLHFRPADGQHFREADLTLHAPIIQSMARGHRQFLSIQDREGELHHAVLSANTPRFFLKQSKASLWSEFKNYLVEGIWHIWIGIDHILFLLALLLPFSVMGDKPKHKSHNEFKLLFLAVAKVVTAFTIAHSITLSLTVLGLITLPARIVESVIAASVVIAALNNVFPIIRQRLWTLALVFGLIHGMGFASVLSEIGLPDNTKILALVAFNVGVEMGQLAIVAVVLPLVYALRTRGDHHKTAMQAASWIAATVASLWLVERSSILELMG